MLQRVKSYMAEVEELRYDISYSVIIITWDELFNRDNQS
jgi:hypothetical protein